MVSRRSFLTVLSGGLCVSRGLRAQDLPRFQSSAELVVLHVTVRDKRGAYVNDLPQDSFAVFENGERQDIRLFSGEDAPVTVGLLVDGSGSMLPNRDRVITAASAFADAGHPDDELCALVFDDDVRSALPSETPFTRDAAVLRDALIRGIHARGRTALYDGIAEGLRWVDRGGHERKVLVVVSDGGDNASTTTFADILVKAQRSNTAIYTVAIVDPDDRDGNPALLEQIARATGGEAFAPKDIRKVPAVLGEIAKDIRQAYTIGYAPTQASAGFRRLKVLARSNARGALVVRARTGYLAGPPPLGSEP